MSEYGPEYRSLPVTFWVDPKDVKLTLNNIEFMDDDRVYLSVNNLFEVRIVRTDEGIVIDVFPSDDNVQYDAYGNHFDEPVATTYAYDDEVTSIP